MYRFVGLPPGRYELVASYQFGSLDQEEWTSGIGQSIELEEGEQATFDLPVTMIE